MTKLNEIESKSVEDEISLKELFYKLKDWVIYLKSKWVLISFVGFLGAAFGVTYSFIEKPNYVATVSFALEDEKTGSGLSGALGLASSLGIDFGSSAGGAFSGANLIELMKSRTLVEKALLNPIKYGEQTQSLADYYISFSGLREKLSKQKDLANLKYVVDENRSTYSLQKDSVLGEIYNKIVGVNTDPLLNVGQRDKKVSIISVEVISKDELFSKALTESLVKEVSEFYIETKSKKARTNVSILQRQADSIRNELNEAISGVAQASDNTFNLNPALNIKRSPTTRRQVDVQANTAILTQLVTNLEMAKVTLLKETPLIQIIDKPILPLKKEEIGKFKSFILGGVGASFLFIIFLVIKRLLIFF